jgi:hypothetical protein
MTLETWPVRHREERSDLISVKARNEAVWSNKTKLEIASGETPLAMTLETWSVRHREARSDLKSVTGRNEAVWSNKTKLEIASGETPLLMTLEKCSVRHREATKRSNIRHCEERSSLIDVEM